MLEINRSRRQLKCKFISTPESYYGTKIVINHFAVRDKCTSRVNTGIIIYFRTFTEFLQHNTGDVYDIKDITSLMDVFLIVYLRRSNAYLTWLRNVWKLNGLLKISEFLNG